jgi:predicted metalloenzyme YecM
MEEIKMTTNKEKEEMINATIAIQKETGVNLFPYKCKKVRGKRNGTR